jgi:hypothetical protein
MPGSGRHTINLTLLLVLLAGCGREDTPEERVRAFVAQVAASAEARAWGDFPGYLADDYGDAKGLSRKEVLALVTRYILAHRSIYVFQRVRDIDVSDSRHPSAVVLAALAGSPMTGPDDLTRVQADLYRFEIALADDGDDLKVTQAAWQPVGVEALLLGQ